MQNGLKKRLLDTAVAPYRALRRSDYYWARGKLRNDPVFAALLDRRVFPDRARILDLGCGRGLLAAWLLAAEQLADAEVAAALTPPRGLHFRGIELAVHEAQRCNTALQRAHGERVSLEGGDIRATVIDDVDVVAMLDVLHYIPRADQERLLDRIRAGLQTGGLFVTRVGNAAGGWRFGFSQIVDRIVASIRSRRPVRTWCRPLAEWRSALESRGFSVETLPMGGSSFANVLLVCRVV